MKGLTPAGWKVQVGKRGLKDKFASLEDAQKVAVAFAEKVAEAVRADVEAVKGGADAPPDAPSPDRTGALWSLAADHLTQGAAVLEPLHVGELHGQAPQPLVEPLHLVQEGLGLLGVGLGDEVHDLYAGLAQGLPVQGRFLAGQGGAVEVLHPGGRKDVRKKRSCASS